MLRYTNEHKGIAVTKKAYSERGFAHWEPTDTSYGAQVRIYESSAALSPHIWMRIDQPSPEDNPMGGNLKEASAVAHMTLDQAREIRDTLIEAIDFMDERFEVDDDEGS